MSGQPYGVILPNGCQIIHQAAANSKTPFPEMIPDLAMYEFTPGSINPVFSGQLGIIPFKASLRLPRHVHISNVESSPDKEQTLRFVTERILVLNGIAMVELNGNVYVVAPNTLVVIAPGVPHTWTACPAGLRFRLPEESNDMIESMGEFLMVYEYEEPTGFFPTEQTKTLESVRDYEKYEGDLQMIRFPVMSVGDIVERARIVLGQKALRMSDLCKQ